MLSIKDKVASSLNKRGIRKAALYINTEKATSVGTASLLHRAKQECKEEMSPQFWGVYNILNEF